MTRQLRLTGLAGAVLLGLFVSTGFWNVARATTTVTYAYDELGRLKTATYVNGAVITYKYDPAGNRTQTISSGSTSKLIWTATSGSCSPNCWGGNNWGASP